MVLNEKYSKKKIVVTEYFLHVSVHNNLKFQVSNVDDVLDYHSDFLSNCLKDCMLTNPDLLKTVHKLMMVCVTFSNFIQVGLHLCRNG